MQMLGNYGAKQNLYVLSPSCRKIVPASLRGLIFIDAKNKFSNFQKKFWIIARNIMCFIINIIIARQTFSAHPILLIVRICYKAGI